MTYNNDMMVSKIVFFFISFSIYIEIYTDKIKHCIMDMIALQ